MTARAKYHSSTVIVVRLWDQRGRFREDGVNLVRVAPHPDAPAEEDGQGEHGDRGGGHRPTLSGQAGADRFLAGGDVFVLGLV